MGQKSSTESCCSVRNQLGHDLTVRYGPASEDVVEATELVDIIIPQGEERQISVPSQGDIRVAARLNVDDARLFVVADGGILFLRRFRGEISTRLLRNSQASWETIAHVDGKDYFELTQAVISPAQIAERSTPRDEVPVSTPANTALHSPDVSCSSRGVGPHGEVSRKVSAGVPHECFCPISHELFKDPVLAADGFTYERSCIQEWWRRRGARSPMTGHDLPNTDLTSNIVIRALCAEHSGHVSSQTSPASEDFYEPSIPALMEMFACLEEGQIRQVCLDLSAGGVRDMDVCVRHLLQRADHRGETAAVSMAPMCCASGMGTEEEARASAMLDPTTWVPDAWSAEQEALFLELLELKFPPVRARKCIDVGLAEDMEDAVFWIEKHQDDTDIDTPIEVLRERDMIRLAMDVLRVATVPVVHRLDCFKALHAVLRHILSDPESDKFRKIRVHNQQFRNRIGRFPPAVALLRSIGFVKGDYWVSAFQKEPCLEFLLPVDSDNPFSQRFVRAFSLIDELLQAPDEWLRTVAPAPPAVQSQWAERDSGDLDDLGGSQVPLRGDVGSREYLADLHERRVKDPRGFQEAMLAAGKRPNHTVVDVRMPAQQDSSISPADATALSTAASGSGSNVRYRSIADRFGGRRHFNLQDIEQVRVEEAIAGTPQYAREYQATKGPSRSYADVVDRSYDPQFLGRRALDETNIFRGQQNMPPLKWSQALSNIAEEHAQQMARGEMPFSHKGFNDRVQKYPFPYMSAAENLAYNGGVADTAKVAVDGWIKSPGHRRNLLGAFDLCGIGVARSSTGEFFFTQLFARTVGGSLC